MILLGRRQWKTHNRIVSEDQENIKNCKKEDLKKPKNNQNNPLQKIKKQKERKGNYELRGNFGTSELTELAVRK